MGRNTRAIIFNVDAGGEAITHPVQRQLESGAGAKNNFAPFRPQSLQRITDDVQQHLFNLIRVVG